MQFGKGDRVAITPCKHTYHEACLSGWVVALAHRKRRDGDDDIDIGCPSCRHDLSRTLVWGGADMIRRHGIQPDGESFNIAITGLDVVTGFAIHTSQSGIIEGVFVDDMYNTNALVEVPGGRERNAIVDLFNHIAGFNAHLDARVPLSQIPPAIRMLAVSTALADITALEEVDALADLEVNEGRDEPTVALVVSIENPPDDVSSDSIHMTFDVDPATGNVRDFAGWIEGAYEFAQVGIPPAAAIAAFNHYGYARFAEWELTTYNYAEHNTTMEWADLWLPLRQLLRAIVWEV